MRTYSVLVMTLSLCLLATADQSYQLVWSDEFNGNSLDLSKWQYEINCDGGGNNELQCYTNQASNVAVRNGSLVITATPQNLNGKQYTSGRINTARSASWKYGRIDFSAKMPNAIYLWPALWMMPRDSVYGGWAASGEIDIMEHRGTLNQDESTLHFGGSWPNNVYEGSGPRTQNFDMTAGYHLYSAIWTPTQIQFLIDGSVYHTQSLQRNFWSGRGSNPYTANGQPFDQYFFIIINLAIGGNFFGGNSQSLNAAQAYAWKDPSLYVDYVRVYQLADTPVPVNPTPAPAPAPAPTPVAVSTAAAADYSGLATSSRCATADKACGDACYNPAVYTCNPGNNLVWGPTPIAAKASTVAAAVASSTRAATPVTSSAAATPAAPASNTCNRGSCGSGECTCNGQCYLPSQYNCARDVVQQRDQLCYGNAGACNGACYNKSQYKCVNGGIQQL